MGEAARRAQGHRDVIGVARASAAAEGTSGCQAPNAQGATKRGPRKMSAAARKRMSQAQKKRWAAKRKAA